MKFGITYNSNKNVWETGGNSCALHLSKMLRSLGYDTEFITLGCSDNNYTDFIGNYKYINDITKESDKVDVLIDIDGLVRPLVRKRIAARSVMFVRGFVQFSELDKSVYPDSSNPRSFDGLSEVWVWDVLNPEDSLDCLRDLYGCPIRRVPYIWDPCHHLLPKSYKDLQQESKGVTFRIMEKNADNTSSSVLLLSGLPELKKAISSISESNKIEYICHSSPEIWNNNFFKANVLDNIEYNTIPVKREDRLSFNQLDPKKDIVLTHTRFCGFRPGLLDLVWLRIPFVHNSPILRDLSEAFATGYYPNNSVSGMIQAVERILGNLKKGSWHSIADKMASAINCWGTLENEGRWRSLLNNFLGCPGIVPVTPIPITTPIIPIKQDKQEVKEQILIGFSDMWPGFNYDSNFLIDGLRNEIKGVYDVLGVDYWSDTCNKSDVKCIIFGPYSDKWRTIDPLIPKIFFSGENWGTKDDPDNTVKLSIVPYRNSDKKDVFYLPTWMTFLNWFTDNKELPSGKECEDNPIRFPIHFATRVHPNGFKERREFCGFVVSNPVCQMRNETFKIVNEYKRVNSGGALFNNIGEQLSLKYAGGGCGDISKYHFLEQHKFQLCFENSQANGYITEKLLHSKIAGCVPIYWGDSNATTDFLGEGFLNVSDCQKPSDVLERIKELEKDKDLCEKMNKTPLLDSEMVQKGYELISDMSRKILEVCNIHLPSNDDACSNNSDKMLSGVGKVVVVNLDRRKDRWSAFINANPEIAGIAERFSAVEGSLIRMDKMIYELFNNNEFGWRKSVMGCALSHINIWYNLANSPDDRVRYFICEDDMYFADSNWITQWNKIMSCVPTNAELMYIGGILPSNKPALGSVLEPVNSSWAKIKPNKLFTRDKETDTFHFCTFSYILTKSGAKKLIKWLEESEMRCYAGIDHILGSHYIGLNKYVSTPLITKCFQDDDAAYVNAEFNSTDGPDTFDSDTRNMKDAFNVQWIISSLYQSNEDSEGIKMLDETPYTISSVVQSINKSKKQIIYYLKEYVDTNKKEEFLIYEGKWLTEVLGDYDLKEFSGYEDFIPGSWIQLMRPHSDKVGFICKQLDKRHIPFRILHLSDEFCTDSIDFYQVDCCKKVVRNYLREDIPSNLNKVITIPLGYHHKSQEQGVIPSFSDRSLVWSFCGTSWFNRGTTLEKFKQITPHKLLLLDNWQGAGSIDEKEYLDILRDSKFCPILRGNNFETFRLYECLENGVIPLVIRDVDGKDQEFWKWIQGKLCLVEINGVDKAISVMEYFLKNPEIAQKYMDGLMRKWEEWKDDVKRLVRK